MVIAFIRRMARLASIPKSPFQRHPQPPAQLAQAEAHPTLVPRRPLAEQPRVDVHLQAAQLAQREGPGDLADDVSDGDTANVGPRFPCNAKMALRPRLFSMRARSWPSSSRGGRTTSTATTVGASSSGGSARPSTTASSTSTRTWPLCRRTVSAMAVKYRCSIPSQASWVPTPTTYLPPRPRREPCQKPCSPTRMRKGRLQVLEAFPPEPVAAQLIESDKGTDTRTSLYGGGPGVHARLVDHGSSNVAMLFFSRSTER